MRLFIRNLRATYRQHLWFTPFGNFTALRIVGILFEEQLAREGTARVVATERITIRMQIRKTRTPK